jgi:hypothetical protein
LTGEAMYSVKDSVKNRFITSPVAFFRDRQYCQKIKGKKCPLKAAPGLELLYGNTGNI